MSGEILRKEAGNMFPKSNFSGKRAFSLPMAITPEKQHGGACPWHPGCGAFSVLSFESLFVALQWPPSL
jgi:hypothetical protein